MNRDAEIAELGARYGSPVRQRCTLDVTQASHAWWSTRKARRRDGEVVLFILRCNGKLILHTKDFYPGGVMRVPSGGIKQGEAVVAAVQREALEETGLQVSIQQFLTLVEFEFHWQEQVIYYPSYSFLVHERAGELRALDTEEHIAAFSEVPLSELPAIAEQLESVPATWQDWGRFRALPHRLAAKLIGS